MDILYVTSVALFEMETGCGACQLIFHVSFPLVSVSLSAESSLHSGAFLCSLLHVVLIIKIQRSLAVVKLFI